MKSNNSLIGTALILTSFILLYTCQKEISPSKSGPSLMASTTNAATGEKINLTVANAPGGTHLIWASTPAANAAFSANGAGSANVSFTTPGTYTVTCYFVNGSTADSFPNYDTTVFPVDTTHTYPPPPYDSTGYPHDTLPGYPPVDTTGYPHDTIPNYPPVDSTGYPHDTIPNFPPPPPGDSTYHPYDSTYLDSLIHANHGTIITSISITITVH